MEAMVFRSARRDKNQTGGVRWLASALPGPVQLGLREQVGGRLVLAITPSAARTVLMVLTAAASADHEVIVA